MPPFLFYFFALFAVLGAFGVILNRNPVSSAFSLIGCFVCIAALFVGLNAYFIGTIQVLVYTGAIMVLFLFIIMLLDLRTEESRPLHLASAVLGSAAGLTFIVMAGGVLARFSEGRRTMPELAATVGSDVHELGRVIFSQFNFPLQMIGVLLLSATIGVVVLCKKELH
jgi:NADH-quinone oxidoreductase subunit J